MEENRFLNELRKTEKSVQTIVLSQVSDLFKKLGEGEAKVVQELKEKEIALQKQITKDTKKLESIRKERDETFKAIQSLDPLRRKKTILDIEVTQLQKGVVIIRKQQDSMREQYHIEQEVLETKKKETKKELTKVEEDIAEKRKIVVPTVEALDQERKRLDIRKKDLLVLEKRLRIKYQELGQDFRL